VAALRTSREREVKLTSKQEIALEQLSGEPLETRFFTSTYYDSPDLFLARCGITLRRRLERGTNLWQLKLPAEDGRDEIEIPGGPAGPPQEIADLLVAATSGRELVPVAILQTRRSGVRFHSGEAKADVVFDAVAVMDGMHVASSFTEIEIELVEGGAGVLRDAEKRLLKLGAHPGDGRNKLARALDLNGDDRAAAPSDAELLRDFVGTQYHAIVVADAGVRLGKDPEAVHKFRVAVRRLRAVLRLARPLLDPEWTNALRTELAWIGGALGPLRDDDVLLEWLSEEAGELGEGDAKALRRLISSIAADRRKARRRVLAALNTDRYRALLNTLGTAAAKLPLLEPDVELVPMAAKEFRRLRRALDGVDVDSSGEALHAARIRGKRARYAAELVAPLRGKAVAKLLVPLRELQDVLGANQDSLVADSRLRELADRHGDLAAAFSAGVIAERRRELADQERARLPELRRRVERAGRKAWA